jgi:hypothetical protein
MNPYEHDKVGGREHAVPALGASWGQPPPGPSKHCQLVQGPPSGGGAPPLHSHPHAAPGPYTQKICGPSQIPAGGFFGSGGHEDEGPTHLGIAVIHWPCMHVDWARHCGRGSSP